MSEIEAKAKIYLEQFRRELDRATFTAYSEIHVDEKQLHGNVGQVLHRQEADAIFQNILRIILEDCQKEIQKRETHIHGINLLRADLEKKIEVLEGRLALIRSLIKKFPDEGYDLVDLLDKQKKWLGRLEKELKT